MATLKEQLAEAVQAAQKIMDGAKAAGREMNDEDRRAFTERVEKAKELSAKVKAAEADEKSLAELNELGGFEDEPQSGPVVKDAASLGDHFVKSAAYKEMVTRKGGRINVSAPEYVAKAAGDPTLTQGLGRTMYGRVVPTPLNRPVVADLLASGQLGLATSLTYYQMGAVTGGFAPTDEAEAKPGMTFAAAQASETLKKIAGWWKYSDEMVEDTPYIKSVIDSQLLVRLALEEERQLLTANAAANNNSTDMVGLLNRSGIQSLGTTGTGAGTPAVIVAADEFTSLFQAITAVYTASFLTPDGIVLNPTDYQALRLGMDNNGQFYGSGPFYGEYGNGQMVEGGVTNTGVNSPGVWGMRTIVTPAIPAGTALVGAFQVGAQVFRKGGVRVDSTNSNGTDFENNLVMIRAEERLLLAVYQPLAFAKVNLAGAAV